MKYLMSTRFLGYNGGKSLSESKVGMISKPLVSVVMPIYNVELYLRDAIDSVVGQTIGFKNNIELILVNDGSPDNSDTICKEYADKYPESVVYINQKNQGANAARRAGFVKSRGEFIHLMDPDDTITLNFYQSALNFFRKSNDSVDVVASKLLYFEAKTGGHYLNYRFTKSRTIRIDKEVKAYQYHIASTVIRRSALQEEWFDGNITIGEDALLFANVVRAKRAYGVVSDTAYNYRIREADNSLMNTQHSKTSYYIDTPKRFWAQVLELWRDDNTGRVAPYIQNYVLNDIQWRLNKQKKQNVLTAEEEVAYKNAVYSTIASLDDETILTQGRLSVSKKLHLIKRKYGKRFDESLVVNRKGYYVGNTCLVPSSRYAKTFGIVLDFITPQGDGRYFIEGTPENDTLHSADRLVIRTSRGDYDLRYVERAQRRKDSFLGDTFRSHEAFESTIEITDSDIVRGVLITFTGQEIEVPIHVKKYTRLSELNATYFKVDSILLNKKDGKIFTSKYKVARHVKFEVLFMIRILMNVRIGQVRNSFKRALHDIASRKVSPKSRKMMAFNFLKPIGAVFSNLVRDISSIFIRVLYYVGLYNSNKPIWIISDRGIGAGDNGEAFFKYLTDQDDLPVKYYFAVNKKSPDFLRMKSLGPVVDMGSLKYKLLFLRSSKIISSQADVYILNPFGLAGLDKCLSSRLET